jgi:mannose-6-phosphate isomerase-like protein (cupin superfamily)
MQAMPNKPLTDKISVLALPTAGSAPEPRRIVEDRGEMALLRPTGAVYNPVYFDIRPGDGYVRGGHFHRVKTEIFYVISGSCRLSFLDLETGKSGALTLRAGEMVTMEARCAHRMEAVEFCRVLEFSTVDVDYSEDTVPYPLP